MSQPTTGADQGQPHEKKVSQVPDYTPQGRTDADSDVEQKPADGVPDYTPQGRTDSAGEKK